MNRDEAELLSIINERVSDLHYERVLLCYYDERGTSLTQHVCNAVPRPGDKVTLAGTNRNKDRTTEGIVLSVEWLHLTGNRNQAVITLVKRSKEMSSPTIYLRGMREVDEQFQQMLRVRDACLAANIPLPAEAQAYFGTYANESDYEVKLQKFSVNILGVDAGSGHLINRVTDSGIIESQTEEQDDTFIYDIHLDKLPTALKTLRLEISW